MRVAENTSIKSTAATKCLESSDRLHIRTALVNCVRFRYSNFSAAVTYWFRKNQDENRWM